jgi:LysR family transcriptional regulator for metE and metH
MEVKHFKLVLAIAELGSLTRAADKLCLTQSALSHQLKEIEEHLETRIFDRVNKKLVITDAGRTFLNSSSVIMDEIGKVRAAINRQIKGETGTIRLTTECYTCYHWLPRIMKSFQTEYPSVEVRLNTNMRIRPLDQLLAGKVDVAIVYNKTLNKNIEYTDLFTDDVVGLVPVNHPLTSKSYLSAGDFLDTHFITQYANFEETSFYEHFLKADRIKPKKLTYIQLTEAAVAMVTEGLGITAMANWAAKPYVDLSRVKVMKLGPKGLKRRWFVATLKRAENPKYMRRFTEQLRNQIPL